MTTATPTAWNTDRLPRLHRLLAAAVDRGDQAGIVTAISRHGDTRLDVYGTFGDDDPRPMQPDTLFRLASVSKPIIAAVTLLLLEDGQLRLDDAITTVLPELADRPVLRTIESPLDDTVPADRPISVRDLLTFRAGYGMVVGPNGEWSGLPIQQAMDDAGVGISGDPPRHAPDEWLRRLATLPLAHQPGQRWLYHTSADLLGVYLARLTGQSLAALCQEWLFAPLGMRDTGFSLRPGDVDRLPPLYVTGANGQPRRDDDPHQSAWAAPVFDSGATGLISTAPDLLAFGEMLLRQGVAPDGKRLLSAAAVTLMTTDHLSAVQRAASPTFPGLWDTRSWGFGVAVVTRRDQLFDSPGRFGWDGGTGTSWWVDPATGVVGVFLSQRVMDTPAPELLQTDFWTAVYQALGD